MDDGAGYQLSTARGSAAELHARPLADPVRPAVWVLEAVTPAVVLGSTQPDGAVDAAACAAAGVDVARRRSGGGAVLVVPGEIVWFDVVVPGAHLAAVGAGDDVGRSMEWLGRRVLDTLGTLGDADEAVVHEGPLVTTRWSRAVCFDGVGPGEIATPAGKLVGISQRRTRPAARFQCAVHVRWDPERLTSLLSPPRPAAAELAPVATLPLDVAAAVPAALTARLNAR